MAIVTLNKKEILKLTGKMSDEKLDNLLGLFSTAVESQNQDTVEVEVAPNRPDLLSYQGFLRAFKSFLGKSISQKYKINKPEKNYKLKINSNLKDIRPYTACAIVKNLNFNDERIKNIIDIQEKLHSTLGRNRKKLAIGIYPLEKITLPIKFEARKPEDIKFIPLEMDQELTSLQILQKHPSGREYAKLLEGKGMFPVFVDAKNNILSMPPIINSHETGKITENTKEVFVECSGSDFNLLKKALNIIVTTLADMDGKVYAMELEYGNKKEITPDLTPEKMSISLENTNKLLGLSLKEKDLEKLLPKMGYEYKKGKVSIPAWRTDLLHEVDLIEDIAIAYGYQNFVPKIPSIATIAEEAKISRIESNISEILIGLGLQEISSYHLIKKEEAEKEDIEIENSKTDYKYLRSSLLTPALRMLSENKDNDYPQRIFEIGTIFKKDGKMSETGINESENLLVAISPGNFTEIKQILDYLANSINIDIKLKEINYPELIEGRTGEITANNKVIGHIGEIHPETLKKSNIKMPVSIFEIKIDNLL